MNINIFLKKAFIIFLLFFYSFHSQAIIRYVKPVAAVHPLGLDWLSASNDIQAMINQSLPGDEIWIAAGTYKPTAGSDRNISFTLRNGVHLYGGFNGTENFFSQRNVTANPTILSGDIDPNGDNDSYHVVIGNVAAIGTTIFDGFTITGGNANGNLQFPIEMQYYLGGGMYLTGLSPIIRNCTFTQNKADFGGALVLNFVSSEVLPINTVIENCKFSNNAANFSGGAYLNFNIPNVTFTRCHFYNNQAGQSGGAAFSQTLDGIYDNCFFYNNNAQRGGAIYSSDGSESYNNCVFWGNDASQTGGAMVIDAANDVFNHCTFAQNTSPGTGSILLQGRYSTITATNSIFWGTPDNSITNVEPLIFTPNISYSIVKGGYSGCVNCPGGNGDMDPQFYNAADLDGANNIMPSGDDGIRLNSNSPALDAGTNTTLNFDILGVDRSATATNIPDLGAYEHALCTNTLTRLYVNDDAPGDKTGSTWLNAIPDLRIAINIAKTCPVVNEIWVAKGTYKPTDTKDRSFSFNMLNNVNIYGGFAGTEIFLNTRNWQKNTTILSGDINPANEEDSYNVVSNFEKNGSAVLDGFTISGGRATVATNINGAGMNNYNADVTVRNCVFKNNTANGNGGGMYNRSSNTNINNCVFAENSANLGGGGLFNNSSSSVTCYNSVFTKNLSNQYGGGIINSSGSNSVYINCTIEGNSATLAGDGMQNTASDPAIINCIFFNNGTFGEVGKEINNFTGPILGATAAVSYSFVEGDYAGCVNCVSGVIDPLFLDAANPAGADGKYATADDGLALSAVSPLVGQGLNSANPTTTDVAGNNRIQGTDINIGAYETGWVISKNTGFWNSANTWNIGREPGSNDYVFIRDNHHVTINIPNAHAHQLNIAPNGKLIIPQPNIINTYNLTLD